MRTGTHIGRYEIECRIGAGGMSDVFRARMLGPEGFEKTVALKMMIGAFSERDDNVRMFVDEARLVAAMEHGNIVRVHEFDRHQGTYFIAMEYVYGADLALLLNRTVEKGRTIEVVEALCIALEACRGLAYAHGELAPGAPVVIHRDISPQNIMISRTGEVKITDFGIAKLLGSARVTRSGVLKGKAAYVSPEQLKGEEIDGRTDIFSLGVVLWEMLAGKRLFRGDSDYEILQKLTSMDIPSPGESREGIDPEVDELVMRMLERDREKRFRTASDVADRLTGLLATRLREDRAAVVRRLYGDLAPERRSVSTKPLNAEGQGSDEKNAAARAAAETVPGLPTDAQLSGRRREAAGEAKNTAFRTKTIVSRAIPFGAAGLAAAIFIYLWSTGFSGPRASAPRGGHESEADTTAPSGGVLAIATPSGRAPARANEQGSTPPTPDSNPATAQKHPELPSAAPETAADTGPGTGEGDEAPGGPERQASARPVPTGGVRHGRPSKAGKSVPHGLLTVEAVPSGARVYLDGKLLGRAPLRARSVAAGRHELVLADDQGRRRTRYINVRKGKTSSFVVVLEAP